MRKILLIGIGAGDPDFITQQAVRALNEVDVFFFIDKGAVKEDLVGLREQLCANFIPHDRYRIVRAEDPERDRTANGSAYGAAVADWHERRAALYEQLFTEHLDQDGTGAFLVWGDPGLYDGTLRIIDQILARGRVEFDYAVIPGISSVQALAAGHRIALNRIGEPIQITTGRRLAASLSTEPPARIDNTFVMLDAECVFASIDDPELDIYWGAYLGTADEVLVAGRLSEVAATIVARRAALRADKGWLMDTYLLRRRA